MKKNNILFLVVFLYLNTTIQAQVVSSFYGSSFSPTQTRKDTSICAWDSINIYTNNVFKQTTNYSVISIPYVATLPNETLGTPEPWINNTDDAFSPAINIGFPFSYYNTTFSQIIASPNAYISFNATLAGTLSSFANAPLPLPTLENIIFGSFVDLDARNTLGRNGSFTVQTLGTFPNRYTIFKYVNVNFLNGCPLSSTFSARIVLYETSNIIEVYIDNAGHSINCSNNYTIGLQGPSNAQFVATPGANAQNNIAFPQAFRYIPIGSPISSTKSWQVNGNPPILVTNDTINSRILPLNIGTNTLISELYLNGFPTNYTYKDTLILRRNYNNTKINIADTLNCSGNILLNAGAANRYIWDNNTSTQTRNINLPGIYTCEAFRNLTSCTTDSLIYQIAQRNIITIDSIVPSGCFKANSRGSIQVYARNTHNRNLQYSLDGVNYQSSPIFTNQLGGNTKTIYVREPRGCIAQQNISLDTFAVFHIATPPSCFGLQDGKIKVVPSNAPTNATFSMNNSPFSIVDSFINLNSGTYNLSIKTNNTCIFSFPVTLTSPQSLQVNFVFDSVNCQNQANGIIVANVSGGSPIYSFSLDNGPTQIVNFYNNLTSKSYNLKIRDSRNCLIDTNVYLPIKDTVIRTALVDSITCFAANNGKITISLSGGTPPYNYKMNNVQASSLVFSNLQPRQYIFETSDVTGCIYRDTFVLTNPPILDLALISKSDIKCFSDQNGQIQTAASGGRPPYTISWSHGANTYNLNNLAPNTYKGILTDKLGCRDSVTTIISEPQKLQSQVTAHDISCFGLTNGAIKIRAQGGVAPYQYRLNALALVSSDSFSQLTPGIYSVQVLDANQCAKDTVVEIKSKEKHYFTTKADSIKCNDNSGIISVNSFNVSKPLKFYLNNNLRSDSILTNLSSGTYLIRIEDAKGCMYDSSVWLPTYPSLALQTDVTKTTCRYTSDGKISAIPSGGLPPYLISLDGNPGSSNTIFQNLTPKSYNLKLTDKNGCEVNRSNLSLPAADSIPFILGKLNATCHGEANGEINLINVPSLTQIKFDQNPNWTNQTTYTSLKSGNYTFSLRDTALCTYAYNVEITQPNKVNSTLKVDSISCNQNGTGKINILTLSGVGNVMTALGNSSFSNNLVYGNLDNGSYLLQFRDALGCIYDTLVNVPYSSQIFTEIQYDSLKCYGQTTQVRFLRQSGGAPPYQYGYNNANFQNNPLLSNIKAGNYVFQLKDSRDCIFSVPEVIIQPSEIKANETIYPVICQNDRNGRIKINPSGGTGNLNINWRHGPTSDSIFNLAGGTYTLVLRDAMNCLDTTIIFLRNPDKLTTQNNIQALSCFRSGDGNITIIPTGGIPPYNVSWALGSTQNTISGLKSGTYSYKLIDSLGCIFDNTLFVPQPDSFIMKATKTNANCIEAKNGKIEIDFIRGGSSPYDITWSNQNKSNAIYGLKPFETYSLKIRDKNNCEIQESFTIDTLYKLRPSFSFDPITCTYDSTALKIDYNISKNIPIFLKINGQTIQNSALFQHLFSKQYQINIQDSARCVFDTSFDFRVFDSSSFTVDKSLESCDNPSIILAQVNSTNAKHPLRFNWINALQAKDSNARYNNSGNFQVLIQDSLSCLFRVDFDIPKLTGPLSLTSEITKPISCFQGDDGVVKLNISGGLTPYKLTANGQHLDSIFHRRRPSGVNFYEVTDQYNCKRTSTIVLSQPSKIQTFIKTRNEKCFGDQDGYFIAKSFGGTSKAGQYSYLLNNSQFNSEGIYKKLGNGTYNLKIIDENACFIDTLISIGSDVFYQVFTFDSVININLGQEVSLPILENNPNNVPVVYRWDQVSGLKCMECKDNLFSGYTSERFKFRAIADSICSFELPFQINVNSPQEAETIFLPNSFSPNGDQKNDIFRAFGNNILFYKLMITNRVGEILFVSDQIEKGWDGTYKSSELSSGSYFYTVEATLTNGKQIYLSGVFNLIR
ncbi:MAG: gliding motility-associated C-terminal domain-containing protein [Chitinophagales bacterium]|nr:gliding motility-associated C-terminal domain-containing protein [Chitinophagales bacterium]